MASFTLREHTADVAVEACGEHLGETFAAVADGLTSAMCDDWPAPEDAVGGERHDLRVVAENPEAALYDYLDQLIYERDVLALLPVDNEANVVNEVSVDNEANVVNEVSVDNEANVDHDEAWVVDASYRGVPLSTVTAREVKAVTYSEMRVETVDGGWEAYVVFDV